MNFLTYEHHDPSAHLVPECVDSVSRILESITIPKRGRTPSNIRKAILEPLYRAGWSDEAKLDATSSITITSVRNTVGLCLQTGNMARIYADMLKLQLLFSREKIIGAIFILFSRITANELGENIANFERLTKELAIFREVISVPVLVLGLEVIES